MIKPGDKVENPNGHEPEAIINQFLKIMGEHGNPGAIPLIQHKYDRSLLDKLLGRDYAYKGKGWKVGLNPGVIGVELPIPTPIWLTTDGRLFYDGTPELLGHEKQRDWIKTLKYEAAETIAARVKTIIDAEKIIWRSPPDLLIWTDPKPWQESWRFSKSLPEPGRGFSTTSWWEYWFKYYGG